MAEITLKLEDIHEVQIVGRVQAVINIIKNEHK